MNTYNKPCNSDWFCGVEDKFCDGREGCLRREHCTDSSYEGYRTCTHQIAIDMEFPDGCNRCPEKWKCWTER